MADPRIEAALRLARLLPDVRRFDKPPEEKSDAPIVINAGERPSYRGLLDAAPQMAMPAQQQAQASSPVLNPAPQQQQGGGLLGSLSGLKDLASGAKNIGNLYDPVGNLWNAFSGGHLNSAFATSPGAALRATELASQFGTPGQVPAMADLAGTEVAGLLGNGGGPMGAGFGGAGGEFAGTAFPSAGGAGAGAGATAAGAEFGTTAAGMAPGASMPATGMMGMAVPAAGAGLFAYVANKFLGKFGMGGQKAFDEKQRQISREMVNALNQGVRDPQGNSLLVPGEMSGQAGQVLNRVEQLNHILNSDQASEHGVPLTDAGRQYAQSLLSGYQNIASGFGARNYEGEGQSSFGGVADDASVSRGLAALYASVNGGGLLKPGGVPMAQATRYPGLLYDVGV